MNVPYFSQYESRDLVEMFIAGKTHGANDPLWQSSGAKSLKEYVKWADHVCGMACLKMIIAYRSDKIMPTLALAKMCRKYGGYKKLFFGKIKGLYYKPFVDFVGEEFGLNAELCAGFPTENVLAAVNKGDFFIASVHPSIRNPEITPPAKGGHLLLLFRNKKFPDKLMFHNPSGFTKSTQEYVEMDMDVFNKFYAARGILVHT